MRILVAFECSGVVRRAFAAKGHKVFSCDLLPSADDSPFHLQGDVTPLLALEDWDMIIAHPPCTYLCVSGIHWNNRVPGRKEKTEEALNLVNKCFAAPCQRIVLENPAGVISTRIRKPDQYVQPWQFGDPYSKMTGLWLKGVPRLCATNILTPEAYQANGRPRWRNQTGTGQNKLGPSPTRAGERAKTYQGIADAMAAQWG